MKLLSNFLTAFAIKGATFWQLLPFRGTFGFLCNLIKFVAIWGNYCLLILFKPCLMHPYKNTVVH